MAKLLPQLKPVQPIQTQSLGSIFGGLKNTVKSGLQTIQPPKLSTVTVKPPVKTGSSYAPGAGNIVQIPNSTTVPNMSVAPKPQYPIGGMSVAPSSLNMSVDPNYYGPTTKTSTGSGSGSKTGSGTATTQTTTSTPVGQALQTTDPNVDPYSEDPAYAKNLAYLSSQADLNVDPNTIRDRILGTFQQQIDATNQIYAQEFAKAKAQGLQDVGSGTAILARRGLAGSGRGMGIEAGITNNNLAREQNVAAQQAKALGDIYSHVADLSASEVKYMNDAKRQGAASYIEAIKSKGERVKANLGDAVTKLIANKVDLNKLDPAAIESLASKLGVSSNALFASYQATQAAASKAAHDMEFNLSEGQARYDVNGKLIASRAKTYAPGSGGSSSSGDPAVDSWVQLIKSHSATISNVPAKLKNAVAVAYQNSLSGGSNGVLSDAAQSAVNLVDELLSNKKLGKISGPADQVFGGLHGGKSALAKNQYNQLKGILSLQNRTQLKGQGAISDFEFKVLEQAASALGRNLSDKDFADQLLKLKDNLLANGKNIASPGGTNSNLVQAPDGQVIEITD